MKKFVLGILTFIWLGFWTIFAQTISPDSAEISVKDPIIMWEATNLKIKILKNDSTMTSYNGTVRIVVTELDWTKLKDNEYTVPSRGWYTFLGSDLWVKEFQRWLEIKKEWQFYVEVSDLNDNEDKILWKQLVNVIRKDSENEIKDIDVTYPIPNATLIGEKVEIIASCAAIPNSKAIIYIDEKEVWTTNVASDWQIHYIVWNVAAWPHTLKIEIPDLEWKVMWKSSNVFFTNSPAWTDGIKNVLVEPERWLMVWDIPTVTVYTDEMIESVKIKLSDRPENESMVMNKNWVGEFIQNVFLLGTWEISLSFETSSSNNSVIKSYDNYKTITVADVPSVYDIKVDTNAEAKTADVSWETTNSSMVTSYLIDWRVEWSKNLSWKDWSEKKLFKFSDVPYDTTINLNITPYRSQQAKHWAASKTIKFVISKDSSCWNSICEAWETVETCPQDCWAICWNWICEVWETAETCPEDCTWWKPVSLCVAQTVPVRTTKICDSYYLVRDKAENVTKYIVYSSTSQNIKDRTKIYETSDTSYEYPFDYESKEDVYMYFWVVWICENWEEVELTWATKVQVWPAENFFLLVCLTLLIYAWIKLFRQTEE